MKIINATYLNGILMKSKEGYIYYIINEHTNINVKLLGKKIKTKSLRFLKMILIYKC